MKKKFFIPIVLVLTLIILVFIADHVFFPKPNRQVYENCNMIQIGMTYDEVVQIMGKPTSETRNGNEIKLLYLAGGIQTETGIGLEFKDGSLVSKNCGADNFK